MTIDEDVLERAALAHRPEHPGHVDATVAVPGEDLEPLRGRVGRQIGLNPQRLDPLVGVECQETQRAVVAEREVIGQTCPQADPVVCRYARNSAAMGVCPPTAAASPATKRACASANAAPRSSGSQSRYASSRPSASTSVSSRSSFSNSPPSGPAHPAHALEADPVADGGDPLTREADAAVRNV